MLKPMYSTIGRNYCSKVLSTTSSTSSFEGQIEVCKGELKFVSGREIEVGNQAC